GLGEASGDDGPLKDYSAQFAIFARDLQKTDGFFRHATEQCVFEQEDGIFWGRGNGWVAAAAFDHLRVRYNRGQTDAVMLKAAVRLADAAVKSQDASGLWWTVLNRPGESYLETSVTALFAFGMARGYRYGLLDESYLPTVRKALEGLKSRMTTDGDGKPVITGISGPTNPGTFATYSTVRIGDDISYGVGAAIMALVETS
ncbi:MAG: glycoside hydrolase family 88 protein, partial [Myxococcota bacterium]